MPLHSTPFVRGIPTINIVPIPDGPFITRNVIDHDRDCHLVVAKISTGTDYPMGVAVVRRYRHTVLNFRVNLVFFRVQLISDAYLSVVATIKLDM